MAKSRKTFFVFVQVKTMNFINYPGLTFKEPSNHTSHALGTSPESIEQYGHGPAIALIMAQFFIKFNVLYLDVIQVYL